MEPDAKYTLVGVIVLSLIAALFGATMWLSRKSPADRTEIYAIDFRGISLSGLQIDGAVTMRGIKIGRVMDVSIPHQDIEAVRVLVEVDADAPIKTNTVAVIQRNLLTGLANVDLNGGTQEAQRLLLPPPQEDYPVIPQGRSELQELQSSMPEVMANAASSLRLFGSAMGRVEQLLSDQNQAHITAILANLREVTGGLKDGKEGLAGTFARMGEILDGAAELVNYTKDELARTFSELRSSVQGIREESGSLTEGVGRAARKVSTAAESLENPRTMLFGPPEGEKGPGE